MTRLQQLFNRAVRGLRKQGFRQSVGPGNGCRYRGNNEMRCAVGWLIPDKRYKASLEGCGVWTSRAVQRAAGVVRGEVSFLDSLQSAHDEADGPADMRRRLLVLAEAHNLDPSAITGKPRRAQARSKR